MSKLLLVCAFVALFSASYALSCTNPSVQATSFTTQDATIVSQIAFISEFTLTCSNKASETTPLFAEVDGKLTPVVRVGTDKFQVRNETTECRYSQCRVFFVNVINCQFSVAFPLGELDGRNEESTSWRTCHSFVRWRRFRCRPQSPTLRFWCCIGYAIGRSCRFTSRRIQRSMGQFGNSGCRSIGVGRLFRILNQKQIALIEPVNENCA